MTKNSLVILLAVAAAGCVRSYGRWPTLEFHHLPYVSDKGERWPHRYICLDRVSETYEMHRPVRVSYIELNPEGKRTVVFIHGLGSYLKFWRYQVDHFAARGFRVVALDMVGFGKSDKPASFPYTMEAMADVVRELCQKLKIERPVLVGHSMGGQTALSFAIRYPGELSALVLASPAGFEHFTKKERRWFEKAFTTSLVKDPGEYAIWGSVRYNNFARWRKDLEWLVEERVRLRGARDFDRYAYANVKSVHGLADNNFVRDNLHRVKVPTLIVFGKMDRLIPNRFMHGGFTRWVMRHGKENIRDAKMVGLARCGHSVQLDCVDEFNAEVLAFINE